MMCPNDTDGDGNCGRPLCPFCGTYHQETMNPPQEYEYKEVQGPINIDEQNQLGKDGWIFSRHDPQRNLLIFYRKKPSQSSYQPLDG